MSWSRIAKRKRLTSLTDSSKPIIKRNEPVAYTPHDYQKKAIKFGLERGAAGFFLDPGLGKTSIILAIIKILLKKKIISKVLIIAPLRVVHGVWPEEIKKWLDFNELTYSIVHGKNPRAREKAFRVEATVYIMNPEGLEWLERQKRWNFDMLVVDESSKFRNTKSLRFKIMRRLVKKFQRRYILTGTPAPNGLLNLFGQMYILDQGRALGAYITHYRNQYFNPSGYGGYDWVIKEGAAERIYDRIRPLILRMEAADYLKLPPLISSNIKIELPPDVMKIYRELENTLITEIDDKKIVAANAAVASQKCRQVANGGIYIEDLSMASEDSVFEFKRGKRESKILHMLKAEAVLELVEELEGQPALIAYEFDHDLERLKKVLGKDTPHIGGGVSVKRGVEIQNAWNAGEIPKLLGQPSSVGFGLNLQGAGRAVIFHSLPWDLEAYDQFIKRVWRQGQTGRVFLYHIVSNTIVDRAILGALARKSRTQKALLDALKHEIKVMRKAA